MSIQPIRLLCALLLSATALQAFGQGIQDPAARLSPERAEVPEVALELPMRWMGELPVVEAWINDEGPFLFLVDTGMAGSVSLRPELAKRLRLAPKETSSSNRQGISSGSAETHPSQTTLRLGDVQFEGVPTRLNLQPGNSLPALADGVLGVHLFSSLVVTLDYESCFMTLRKPPYRAPRGAQLLPLISKPEEAPRVQAQRGDMLFPLGIATGRQQGVLLTPETGSGAGLQIGSLAFERTEFGVAEQAKQSVLGSGALKGRVLTLDQVGRQAWIRSAERDIHLAERSDAPDRTTLFNDFEYPIDLSTGRPWLQVSLGDREPDSFLFDTGASLTVLDDDYAKELGLERIGTRGVGDPSSPEGIQCPEYLIDELSFGDVVFEGIPAISMDLHAVFAGAGPTPKAILGLPTFMDVVVTLDYPQELLHLTSEALPADFSGPGSMLRFDPDARGGGLPIFDLELAGRTVPTHLDSGAPTRLALPTSLMSELELDGEPTLMGQARTVSGSFDILRADLHGEIRLGDLQLPNRGVVFMSRLRQGNLGGAFLRDHLVTLDLARHRAWFRVSR